jgi:hypothetical protein
LLQARFLAQCLEYEKRSSRHAFWDTGELLANAMAVATMLGSGQSLHVAFVDTQVAGAVEIMRNYVDVSDWVGSIGLQQTGKEEPLRSGGTSLVHGATSTN